MNPVLLEFHDGRISAVAMPAPGTVTISFSHLCGYVRTNTRSATRLETELAVSRKLEVSNGMITVDGTSITPHAAERFMGACRLSLEFAGPFIGKLIVEGGELELRVSVGETFEQFHGAID